MTNIPEWLTANESYEPKKDNASFIEKSSKSIMRALSSIKRNNENKKAMEANTSIRLFGILVAIILTSVSRNFSFVIFMISLVIVRMAFLHGEKIKSWLKTVLPVIFLSFIILLPSIFLGNPKTPITIVSKIFVCISMVIILNLTTSFNNITRALRRFHIPSVVIFTFDLTIKYIFILGEVCANMLLALKIRSIGRNNDKKASVSGILGTVFIKAKASAEDTARAMECRGFSGSYVVSKEKFKLNKYDFISFGLFALIAGAFVYLEVLI